MPAASGDTRASDRDPDECFVDCTFRSPRVQAPLENEPMFVWEDPGGRPFVSFHKVDEGYLIRFHARADFLVTPDGNRATCWPAPGAEDGIWRHLYLNQVRPLMRGRRGELSFHGSAVEFEGGAIAFVAPSRHGKSTLAAAFARAGHGFLTDDGLVLDQRDEGFVVMPDHPWIRLWKDSHERLVHEGAATAPQSPLSVKNRILADTRMKFCSTPKRFLAAYFLANEGREIRFERLGRRDALFRWMHHAFVLDIEQKELVARHFDRLATLSNAVPCFELDYPRRYEDLPPVQQAILAHAAGLGS